MTELMIQMRYVILPILGILYVIWTYKAISRLIRHDDLHSHEMELPHVWLGIHAVLLIGTIIILLLNFCFNNW